MDLLKNLDLDENNEPDLIWKSSALFGTFLTLGAQGKLHLTQSTPEIHVLLDVQELHC